jgi:hypothetical protein
MAKADRVHSTPPTNTSVIDDTQSPGKPRSRRSVLGAIAAGAAALTLAPARAAAPAIDPVFDLIAEKRAADFAHCEAIDAQDEAESDHEYGDAVVDEAWQRCCDACGVVNEADWRLATTPPTTLAGIAAVLRFANEIEDGGMEWPTTDTVGPEGWHYQLRATMAAAVEAIIRQMGV